MRLTSQHRALYCYLMLMLWIFLLVAGMYKYIGQEDAASVSKNSNTNLPVRMSPINFKQDSKVKRIYKFCNPPEDITIGSEGLVDETLSLEGVVMVMRHGSRGPLSHVRNLSSLHCTPLPPGGPADTLYRSYVSFVKSHLMGEKLLHPSQSPYDTMGWSARQQSPHREIPLDRLLGTFFGAPSNLASLPLIPPTNCQLGQLTGVGVAQMAKIGIILKDVYASKLGLLGPTKNDPLNPESNSVQGTVETENMPSSADRLSSQKKKISPSENHFKNDFSAAKFGMNIKEGYSDTAAPTQSLPLEPYNNGPLVMVYSTRHRRTLQSALAFLHAFLPPSILLSTNPLVLFRDSHSVSFCTGEDCSCAAAEKLLPPNDQDERQDQEERLASHPAVARLVKTAAATILEVPGAAASPSALTVHDALLAFVCHGAPLPCHLPPHHAHTAADGSSCLHPRDLSGLSAYLEWEGKVRSRRKPGMTRALLLRAYGIVRAIVGHILQLMSQSRKQQYGNEEQNVRDSRNAPRFILYSGHDTTLRMLGAAFGVPPEGAPPQYASRFIIEVYRKKFLDGVKKTGKAENSIKLLKEENNDVHIQGSTSSIMKNTGKMLVSQAQHFSSVVPLSNSPSPANITRRGPTFTKGKYQKDNPKASSTSTLPAATQYYFRIVYNGKDMTNQVPFCKESLSSGNKDYSSASQIADGASPFLRKAERQKQSMGYMCPIEAIVRFLHDNYFSAFNATNFKDSCLMHS